MTIFIDHRAGSEELIVHAPFCFCRDCGSKLKISRKKSGRILKAECPTSPSSHSGPGMLVDLAKYVGTGRSSADVYFEGNGPNGKLSIGVEVKKLFSDLLTSLDSGRLPATQIPAMAETFDICWLVVYGACRVNLDSESETYGALQTLKMSPRTGKLEWTDYYLPSRRNRKKPSPLAYSSAERFMAGPSLKLGFPGFSCYRVANIQEAAWWIAEVLYGSWQKRWCDHKSFRQFDRSGTVTRDFDDEGGDEGKGKRPTVLLPSSLSEQEKLTAAIAKELPGIGYERAVAIAKHFHVPQDMATAGVDEWAGIEVSREGKRKVKIGEVRARQIVKFWTGRDPKE